jgi:hypothetical protein
MPPSGSNSDSSRCVPKNTDDAFAEAVEVEPSSIPKEDEPVE